VLPASLRDFRQIGLLIVGNLEALTRFDPQYAREMAGFVARQFGGSAADGIHKESTPCQIQWWHKPGG
jgi:hypothetical protein